MRPRNGQFKESQYQGTTPSFERFHSTKRRPATGNAKPAWIERTSPVPTSPPALRCSAQEDSPCTKNRKAGELASRQRASVWHTSAQVHIVRALEVPKPVRDLKGRMINSKPLQEDLATAIGDGLALGVDRLRGAKAKSKVPVLLTDGDNNAGAIDPREAATILANDSWSRLSSESTKNFYERSPVQRGANTFTPLTWREFLGLTG